MSGYDFDFQPDIITFDDLDEDAQNDLIRQRQEHFRRTLELQQAKLRRQRMARHNESDSSESETGRLANKLNNVAKLTPDTDTPQELVKLDPAEIGMSIGYKHLYSGKEDKRGRFQWQTTIPEDLGKPAEDAESEKFAIIVRNVKVYNDPKKVLSVHSIVIQSPLLKEVLKGVLAGYPGVTVGLKRLEFSGRFEPLIHRWSEFNRAIHRLKHVEDDSILWGQPKPDNKAPDRLKHAELLHDLLAKEFKDTIDASTDLKGQGVMTYEHLWTLFQPGSLVFSKQQGQDRIFRLHSSKYGQDRNSNPVYWLTCQYVDYDGTRWGTNKLNVCIPAFDGTRPITSLQTLPLDFHSSKAEIAAKLIERGSKVEKFAGSHYRAYNGIGWRLNNMGQKERYSVKGRIVIDTFGWNRFNPNWSIFVTALHIKDNQIAAGIGGGAAPPGELGGEDEYDEGYDDDDGGMPLDGFFADEEDEESKRVTLTDEQKMICTPLVRGYALKEKLWLNFFVNAVRMLTSFQTCAGRC